MQLIGVIHLLPLPAGPGPSGGLQAVIDRARQDAAAMAAGGLRHAIIENLGDAPFEPEPSEPHVIAQMTRVAMEVRAEVGDALELGINVLRNDARGALAVASACDGRFIRVNVLLGSAWTDQGLIQGQGGRLLRYRRELGLEPMEQGGVRIAADVHVKHATPAGRESIDEAAADLVQRGRADVVIVTGQHTGGRTDPDDLRRVRARIQGHPLWVGSGVEPSVARALGPLVDGAIVGTWLHRDARLGLPVEADRVRWLVEAAGG